MAQLPADASLPRRKQLPCEFTPSKQARNKALTPSFFAAGFGALLIWAGANGVSESPVLALGFCAVGLLLVAGSWFLASSGFVSVTIDEEGVLIRKPGRVQRVRWGEMGQVAFGATVKAPDHGPSGGGAVGSAGRALANYMADDVKPGDTYLVGRVRQHYEPSAVVSDAKGREQATFTHTLGWPFFTALYAEVEAREIEIGRTS